MQVFIIDADNENSEAELQFDETAEEIEIEVDLRKPSESFSEPDPLKEVFGYSLTLNQLNVSYDDSNDPSKPTKAEKSDSSITFYYDCEGREEAGFTVTLKIKKDVYDVVNSDRYEIVWKKFFKPSVKYTLYQDFIYCAERKKKIDFNSINTATFTNRKMQTLNLIALDSEENLFKMESNNFEIIGFEKGSSSNESFQIIPLGSQRIFNDNENYTFSLLVEEKKEEFPLDFFIKNGGGNNSEIPPSGEEWEEDNGLNNPLT